MNINAPPTPNPGVTWHVRVRQVDMNVNTPTHPKRWRDVDVKFACFTKRARLLARFSARWQKQEPEEEEENEEEEEDEDEGEEEEESAKNV